MQRDDRIRLQHMLDGAMGAMDALRGKTRVDLDRDRVWTMGLVKHVEIIGEAAARISVEAREQYSQIPRGEIVGMRNRLVHTYFDIDRDQFMAYLGRRSAGPGRTAADDLGGLTLPLALIDRRRKKQDLLAPSPSLLPLHR